jgi:hypothetical protein
MKEINITKAELIAKDLVQDFVLDSGTTTIS